MDNVFDSALSTNTYGMDLDIDQIRACNPKNIFCFNVPKNAFEPGAKTWSQMNTYKNGLFKDLVYVISEIAGKPYLAKEYKEIPLVKGALEERDYYNEAGNGNLVPKILTGVEELYGKNKKVNFFVGFRFWIATCAKDLDFVYGIKNLVDLNKRKNQSSVPKRRKINGSANDDDVEQCIEKYESMSEIYYKLFHSYQGLSAADIGKDLSDASDPRQAMKKFDPVVQLNPEYSMDRWIDDICDEQSNISNYFDVDDGIGIETFKGFPIEGSACKVNPQFFNPKSLSQAVLPNWVKMSINKNVIHEAHLEDQLGRTREQMKKMMDLIATEKDEKKKERLKKENTKLRDKARKIKNDLENNHRERTDAFMAGISQGLGNLPMEMTMWLEKEFARYNDFIKLRLDNLEEFSRVSKEFEGRKHTVEGQKEFAEAMDSLRRNAFNTWFNTWQTSSRIPDIALKAKKYFQELGDRIWHEKNIMFDDPEISVFGNWIAMIMAGLDKCSHVDTNFQLSFQALIAALQSFAYMYDLRTNMLLTGPKAAGKSFILELIVKLLFWGATMTVGHQTSKANNTESEFGENDHNDKVVLVHEANNSHLGYGQNGKDEPADSQLKTYLTTGYLLTDTLKMIDGVRKRYVFCNRISRVEIWAANEAMKNPNGPVASRFIINPVTNKKRPERKDGDTETAFKFAKTDALDSEYVEYWKKLSLLTWMYHKQIEAGILPPLDENNFDIVAGEIFSHLQRSGIPHPGSRKTGMARKLAVSLQMMFNVHLVFFSELGKKFRESEDGIESFNPELLLELGKHGIVTNEVAVFVITLCEHQWIPSFKLDIAKTIAKVTSQWPHGDKTVFHFEDGVTHYVKVPMSDNIWQDVKTAMRKQPSRSDMISAINALSEDYIESIPLEETTQGYELKIIKMRELRKELLYKTGKASPIDLDKKPIPSKKDDISNMYMEYVGKTAEVDPSIISIIESDASLEPKRELTPVERKKTSIPCVRELYEENKNSKTKNLFLLISIEFLKKDYKGLLMEALNRLCHKHSSPSKMVTGFLYEKMLDGKNVEFFQVFQTFNMKRNPNNALIIRNRNAWSQVEFDIMCNYSQSHWARNNSNAIMQKYNDMPLSQRSSSIYINYDTDKAFAISHLKNHGIQFDTEELTAIPSVARYMVGKIRKDEPEVYKIANTKLKKTYPEDIIKDLEAKIIAVEKDDWVTHISEKFKLEPSQREQLNELTLEQIKSLTPAQIKKIRVDPMKNPEHSATTIPLTRLIAGRDTEGMSTSKQQGPLHIEGFDEILAAVESFIPQNIRKKPFTDHDDIEEQEFKENPYFLQDDEVEDNQENYARVEEYNAEADSASEPDDSEMSEYENHVDEE